MINVEIDHREALLAAARPAIACCDAPTKAPRLESPVKASLRARSLRRRSACFRSVMSRIIPIACHSSPRAARPQSNHDGDLGAVLPERGELEVLPSTSPCPVEAKAFMPWPDFFLKARGANHSWTTLPAASSALQPRNVPQPRSSN
jgi:hypothetical protein